MSAYMNTGIFDKYSTLRQLFCYNIGFTRFNVLENGSFEFIILFAQDFICEFLLPLTNKLKLNFHTIRTVKGVQCLVRGNMLIEEIYRDQFELIYI